MGNELARQLEDLYRILPGVPCIAGCKGCCVSPTITLIEFIHLMEKACKMFSGEVLAGLIQKPMKPHPRFPGNYFCRFQDKNGFCIIHPGRAMACRLHGLPVIDELGVSNLENCTIMEKSLLPDVPVKKAKEWLENLISINREIQSDYGETFTNLIGLNIECWLDILFLDDISNTEIRDLQVEIRKEIPWQGLCPDYHPHTEIVEKMDTILLLKMTLDLGDRETAETMMKKLGRDYPSTGNFFHDQCKWMLEHLRKQDGNPAPES